MAFAADTEILATALQDNADKIVPLLESQTDKVVARMRQEQCITGTDEDEVYQIEKNNQKIRYLLALIIGRSFLVLLKFLDMVTEFGKEEGKCLASSIYNIFGKKRQKNIVIYKCAYCSIKEHIKLNDLANYLWQRHQIKCKLYRDILGPQDRGITESDLWNRLFTECNTMTHVVHIQVYLNKDNLYSHIVDEIWAQAKHQNFNIRCGCSSNYLKKRFLNPHASIDSLDDISTHANSVQDFWSSISHMPDTSTIHKKKATQVKSGFRRFTCCIRKDETATKDDCYSLTSTSIIPN